MSPDVVQRARVAAPEVVAELAQLGLSDAVVAAEGPVWVESSTCEVPVPLHDVDDVRWYALEEAARR